MTEKMLIDLIATDRISIPIKSMAGKLDRQRPKLGKAFADEMLGLRFDGERAYARVEYSDQMKARGMRDGIEVFSEQYPRYGAILNGIIEQQRAVREVHMYFGMNNGCRITADDYAGVMQDLGFTPAESERLYPKLMDISRKLSRQRGEERSVMIG